MLSATQQADAGLIQLMNTGFISFRVDQHPCPMGSVF
jgi:hypothetical protein